MAWYSAGHPRFYKIVLAPDCSAPFIPAACILVSRPQLRPRLRSGCSRTVLVRELPFFYCGGEHVLVPVFLRREVRPSVFRASLATAAVGNFRSPGARSFAASGGRADGGRFDCRRDPRSKHFAADHGSKSSAGLNSKAVRQHCAAPLYARCSRPCASSVTEYIRSQPSNGPQCRSARPGCKSVSIKSAIGRRNPALPHRFDEKKSIPGGLNLETAGRHAVRQAICNFLQQHPV